MTGLAEALHVLGSPLGLALIIAGTALGIIVGAIPGLTGTMLIALTLPLTYGVDAKLAMTLLIAMYVGSISGGMITAILLRMPGTPASIMTTLDGYPMARNGQPGRALGLAIMGSLVGGLISWAFLVLLSHPVAAMAAKLGPFEYFSLVMMALVLIASVAGPNLLPALFAGVLGIFASMPGIAAATGQARLTFGITELNNGFGLLPVLIGLFAVNQVFRDVLDAGDAREAVALNRGEPLFVSLADVRAQAVNLVRSAVVGTWIGLLPGIGANIGAVAAYSLAKNTSATPEKFGTGHDDGIVAAETANNATIGGALIPLIALGLPGSVVEAILLGALIVHGLQPGPRLFQDSPDVVYTIMGACLLATIVMAVMMTFSARFIAKLAQVPRSYLLPVVLTFCVAGSFALSNRMFDVWVMLGFGLVGFTLESFRMPLAPFTIGFVLGPLAEESLSVGLMASHGSYLPIITRPLSAAFFFTSIVLFAVPLLRRRRSRRHPGPPVAADSQPTSRP